MRAGSAGVRTALVQRLVVAPAVNVKQTQGSVGNSLVLSDWAANVELLGLSANAVVYELLVLSLLYDKIFVQDEVFALSDRLAEWLGQPYQAPLVRELFALGSIVVLTHPEFAYSTDDADLRKLSEKRPIAARAAYIQRRGTKEERPFAPTARQERLYDHIDASLRELPACRRPVRLKHEPDPTMPFAAILKTVLQSKHHMRWRASAFSGIPDRMAAQFVAYIEDPENVAKVAATKRQKITVPYGSDGRAIFNRSLGYQAAHLYPPRARGAMRRLIQTCFAAPFCAGQGAAGRYSPALRELLLLPPDAETATEREEIVTVETVVDIPLVLPPIGDRFARSVRDVRESVEGRSLRRAIWNLGEDPNFEEQVECWRAVADTLAGHLVNARPGKTATVRASLMTFGKKAVTGAILGGIASKLMGEPAAALPGAIAGAFLSEGMGIVYAHGQEVARNAYRQQEVREQLERAVAFRCTTLALPPLSFRAMQAR